MKYLNSPVLFALNQALTVLCSSNDNVYAKAELFQVGPEDLAEYQTSSYERPVFQPISPSSFGSSSIYPVDAYATSKHFPILKAAFEQSFPDFDFSMVMPWHFKLISSADQAHINITWAFTTYFSGSPNANQQLWHTIDSEIGTSTCDIYAYEPDCPDPFSQMGTNYNLIYFFLHHKLSKVMLFQICDTPSTESDDVDEDMEDKYGYGFF